MSKFYTTVIENISPKKQLEVLIDLNIIIDFRDREFEIKQNENDKFKIISYHYYSYNDLENKQVTGENCTFLYDKDLFIQYYLIIIKNENNELYCFDLRKCKNKDEISKIKDFFSEDNF